MAFTYDKKVQLAILNEVAEKRDGINPIEIDLSDEIRRFNFSQLHKNRCFQYFGGAYIIDNLAGLSQHGHKFHSDISAEIQKDEWELEQVMRDRKRFCYDTVAVVLSVIALILSIIAMLRTCQ